MDIYVYCSGVPIEIVALWKRQIGEKSRKKCLWVKMKPEYSDQMSGLDFIILGAGFAQGRMRSGLLSKFLVGVAVPTADGSPPSQFYPISRVSWFRMVR